MVYSILNPFMHTCVQLAPCPILIVGFPIHELDAVLLTEFMGFSFEREFISLHTICTLEIVCFL
eukprot:c37373_g1_i1 orf=49-240(+)